MSRRMTAVDAQTYWMSAKVPNDQFLLFAFDGMPANVKRAVEELGSRAAACDELRLRVQDDGALRYPRWVAGGIAPEQFVVRALDDDSWQGCLDAVARLADEQLDLRRMAWRVHVFADVSDVPNIAVPAAVVVVQVSHALGDGRRSAALAGALLGRGPSVQAVTVQPTGSLVRRGVAAARTHRQLVRGTEAGLLPPPGEPRPALSTNARPDGLRRVRTLIRHRTQLRGPTVTASVLAAVSDALAGYLRDRGEDTTHLGAEVPIAKPSVPQAHNHFRNVSVSLHAELPRDQRYDAIVNELAGHRRRGEHPAMAAASRAFAAVPAPLLRWGVTQFDADVRSPTVTGNTVVSSVNRGAADLYFGEARVALTAGYPALSPLMSLTHGVHGIGDAIAISVHAAESAVDIDDYRDRLNAALS